MIWLAILVSVERGLHPSLTAQAWTVAGKPGPCRLTLTGAVVEVDEEDGPPWPSARLRVAVPTPPLKNRIGSAVPLKAMTGTRRVARHGLGSTRPETAATAAKRADMVEG